MELRSSDRSSSPPSAESRFGAFERSPTPRPRLRWSTPTSRVAEGGPLKTRTPPRIRGNRTTATGIRTVVHPANPVFMRIFGQISPAGLEARFQLHGEPRGSARRPALRPAPDRSRAPLTSRQTPRSPASILAPSPTLAGNCPATPEHSELNRFRSRSPGAAWAASPPSRCQHQSRSDPEGGLKPRPAPVEVLLKLPQRVRDPPGRPCRSGCRWYAHRCGR
jgi:hypothetical protein